MVSEKINYHVHMNRVAQTNEAKGIKKPMIIKDGALDASNLDGSLFTRHT